VAAKLLFITPLKEQKPARVENVHAKGVPPIVSVESKR